MHGGLERGNQILEQVTKPNLFTTKDALVEKRKGCYAMVCELFNKERHN